MIEGEGGDAQHVGRRPVPAPQAAKNTRAEEDLLHQRGQKDRQRRDRPAGLHRHIHHGGVVGVLPLAEDQHQHAVDREVNEQHRPVAGQHLPQHAERTLTEGIKIPPQEGKLGQQHIARAYGVDRHVQRALVPLGEEMPQQPRQQGQMHRQPQQRQQQLRPALAAGKRLGKLSLSHQPLAFFCSVKSRFMASSGVRVLRSVASSVSRSSSAATSAKLI